MHQETYDALQVEAQRRLVASDELADELVRRQLPALANEMRDALDVLAAVGAKMPEVDAVRLVRDARQELDRRGQQ